MQSRITIQTQVDSRGHVQHTREFIVSEEQADGFVQAWARNCEERVIRVLCLTVLDRGNVQFRSDTIIAVSIEPYDEDAMTETLRQIEEDKRKHVNKSTTGVAINPLPPSLLR